MQFLVDLVSKLLGLDLVKIIGAVSALIAALIGVALIVPGDQPEKFLQKILDLLKKISL